MESKDNDAKDDNGNVLYRVWFNKNVMKPDYSILLDDGDQDGDIKLDNNKGKIYAEAYYEKDKIKIERNNVKFTPIQIETIKSGMHYGLTLCCGPPGTGKTDVATQIINNLYHNFKNERILLITHSNQALNDLFEKIMKRNINEKHLLRLGYGNKELNVEGNFTQLGRINHMLTQRINKLKIIQYLCETLRVAKVYSSTCEIAINFYNNEVLSKWQEFEDKLDKIENKDPTKLDSLNIGKLFPFTEFIKGMQSNYNEAKENNYEPFDNTQPY